MINNHNSMNKKSWEIIAKSISKSAIYILSLKNKTPYISSK
uniref:Uncharacterized protein n=1 Tax=Rhizophora mucronata TaxID=61149 RepID=A0A2P2NA73_RHIMU